MNKSKLFKLFSSDTNENNLNNFDLFNSPCNDNYFNFNFIDHEDYNNEAKENIDGVNNSSEFNLSPTDGDNEKEADEISLLNIDNRRNIIFLQL